MWVKILQDWGGFRRGDVRFVPAPVAAVLLEKECAEVVREDNPVMTYTGVYETRDHA